MWPRWPTATRRVAGARHALQQALARERRHRAGVSSTSVNPAATANGASSQAVARSSSDMAVRKAFMIRKFESPMLPVPREREHRQSWLEYAQPGQRTPAPASASAVHADSRGSSVMYFRPPYVPNRPLMLYTPELKS